MSPRARARLSPHIAAMAVVAAIGLGGCGSAEFSDRLTTPLSEMHDTRPVISGSLAIDRSESVEVALPFAMTGEGVVLVGDVHSRPGTEIVVVDRAGVAIVGTDGTLISTVDPAEKILKAGVLTDMDGDRLADVVVGVTGRADPVVRVFNGLGKEVVARRIDIDGRIAGSVQPVAIVDDDVVILAGESSPEAPRGLLRLAPVELTRRWFSAVPTALDGAQLVRGGTLIAVANHTQNNGEYNELGIGRGTRYGFDARARVVMLSADGEIVTESAAPSHESSTEQSISFLPHGENTVLAHLVDDRESLILLDALTGQTIGPRIAVDSVHQILTTPLDDQVGCVYVVTEEPTWEIRLAAPDLSELGRFVGRGDPPRVVTALRRPSGLAALAIHNGFLVVIDAAGIRSTGQRTSITHGLAVVENEQSVLIAGLGNGLELINLPKAVTQRADDL